MREMTKLLILLITLPGVTSFLRYYQSNVETIRNLQQIRDDRVALLNYTPEKARTKVTKIPSQRESSLSSVSKQIFSNEGKSLQLEDFVIQFLPLIVAIGAFFTFEQTREFFGSVMLQGFVALTLDAGKADVLNENIICELGEITAVSNGVVIPSIGLLFATITSVTISSLRERLKALRIIMNNEASSLQKLFYLLNSLSSFSTSFENERYVASLTYLEKYTSRIIQESQSSQQFYSSAEAAIDSELLLLFDELFTYVNRVILQDCETSHKMSDEELTITRTTLSRIDILITQLQEYRNARVGALSSNLPLSHYVTLTCLALGICIVFLIDANCVELRNDFLVLRIFWSFVLGTFTTMATTCYDLRDPFRYSYSISTEQFYILKDRFEQKRKKFEIY